MSPKRATQYRVTDPRMVRVILALIEMPKREFAARAGYTDVYVRQVLNNHKPVGEKFRSTFIEALDQAIFERAGEE